MSSSQAAQNQSGDSVAGRLVCGGETALKVEIMLSGVDEAQEEVGGLPEL